MATLADELQNDLMSSDEEDADAQDDIEDHSEPQQNDHEAEANDSDEEMGDAILREAEEETEARLNAQGQTVGTGKDLGNVSKFMKSMESILEVSPSSAIAIHSSLQSCLNRSDDLPVENQPIPVRHYSTTGASDRHAYRGQPGVSVTHQIEYLLHIY